MINVLLACHPDRIIPEAVMTSILNQGVPLNIHICAHIGTGAWKSRQYLKDRYPKDCDYVLTMDNDIVLPDNAIVNLIQFLENNPDFAAIGISKQFKPVSVSEEPHIDAAPLLFRPHIYDQLTYRHDQYCECLDMTRDLRNMNHRIGFIGGLKCQHLPESHYERR